MKIAYTAYDRSGKLVADAIEAAGPTEAGEQLRRQGLFVTQLLEGAAAEAARSTDPVLGKGSRRHKGRTGRLRQMSAFVRQLSILVATGTPMVEAIGALERQIAPGAFRNSIANVRRRVEEGAQLSDALASHPLYFDAVSRSLIAAGESGGQLDAMLRRLASLTRQQLKVRSTVIGTLIYPALLIFVSIAVLCLMIGFVLPRFQTLFDNLGAKLPPTTQWLMAIGQAGRSWWWVLLGGVLIAGGAAKLWLDSPRGRVWFDRTIVRLPQAGRMARSLATARTLRVLGVLLEGRVPMLDALRLTREATGNSAFNALVQRAEELVTRGENVSTALAESPLIDRAVVEAVRSGERAGQTGAVLTNLADFMDEDNELVVKALSSILEPLILIALGCIVGFVAISMFLPLFDLTSQAGTGGGGG